MERALRNNPKPLVRDEDDNTCPFYGQTPTGKKHLCLSRSNDLIAISPRYVDDYCLRSQHVACSLFLHADEDAKLYVAQLRERQEAAKAPTGRVPSDAAGSHAHEAKSGDAEVMQVETVRAREAPDAQSEPIGDEMVQSSDKDPSNATEGAELVDRGTFRWWATPPDRKAGIGAGRAEEIVEVHTVTDGEVLPGPSPSSPLGITGTQPEIVESDRGEPAEVVHEATVEQGAVSIVVTRPMSATGGGLEPVVPIDAASVSAESTTPREVSPEPVPAAPAETQPIPVESIPVDAIAADVAEPSWSPLEPPVILQERSMQARDSMVDIVDSQVNHESPNAADEVADTSWALDAGSETEPVSPVIVAPADGSVVTSRSMVFVGKAEPHCAVRLHDWTVPVVEGQADAEGRWNLTVHGVQDGSHLYTAQAIQTDGSASPSSRACTVTVQAAERPPPPADYSGADGQTTASVLVQARSRRTVALVLAIALVLAAISTVVLGSKGSPHPRTAPTATRRGAPVAAVPAPATTWHFPAMRGPGQQVIVTLSNRNPITVSAQIIAHGSLVQRVQIPPKNGAEIELPPRVARMPLTIRATGPIVPQRLAMNGSRVRPSYGIRGL